MNAVRLSRISFRYEESRERTLNGADFELNYGEIALFSGASGSGKSTLMSIICGIIPHITTGEIYGKAYIDGEDAGGMTMAQINKKVGVVLQNADAQIIQSIVEDEIAFGCENFGMSREDIALNVGRACDKMGLSPVWNTRTLSGGQKQRLITACTLATGQKIIVLDEPLANLDGEGAEILAGALRKLASKGYAILIIEHRVDKVAPYADVIWHIENGRTERVTDKSGYVSQRVARILDICAPSSAGETLIRAEKVGFRVKDRMILSDVDLEVYRGERLLILGENGCGKTTLTRLLSGICRPTSGRIERFDSKRGILGLREKRHDIGVVYQNPNYQLFMPTVEKEIAFGAKDKAYARETMRLFGLERLADRHPQSLSEGQKRLVSVAAVCASAPRVLILDEPTVGQDHENLRRLVTLVSELHSRTGNSVITVTHDARCADALCDRAAVVAGGTIAMTGGKEVADNFFKNTEKRDIMRFYTQKSKVKLR